VLIIFCSLQLILLFFTPVIDLPIIVIRLIFIILLIGYLIFNIKRS